jgi:hypothetical protein
MLMPMRFRPGIERGAITLTFRRWKRPQVIAGNTYRTAAGRLVVDAVDVVDPAGITEAESERAGFPSRAELLGELRGPLDLPTYRVRFHLASDPDPRAVLAASAGFSADDIADLTRRLARLDRASSHGSWTIDVLRAIEARPGVRAADLAEGFGREKEPFKLDVRKLKNLGLTLSLEVGYRLSPRGEAYLAAVRES